MAIAYRVGKAESVLIAAGVKTAPKESQKVCEQIQHGLLASAAAGLAKASVSKSDNPALEPALRIIAARKRQKPIDQQVITGPGIGASLQSFFNETVPPEIRAQILEHKQQCASAAAAMPHDAAAQTRQATPIDPDVQPPPPPKQKT